MKKLNDFIFIIKQSKFANLSSIVILVIALISFDYETIISNCETINDTKSNNKTLDDTDGWNWKHIIIGIGAAILGLVVIFTIKDHYYPDSSIAAQRDARIDHVMKGMEKATIISSVEEISGSSRDVPDNRMINSPKNSPMSKITTAIIQPIYSSNIYQNMYETFINGTKYAPLIISPEVKDKMITLVKDYLYTLDHLSDGKRLTYKQLFTMLNNYKNIPEFLSRPSTDILSDYAKQFPKAKDLFIGHSTLSAMFNFNSITGNFKTDLNFFKYQFDSMWEMLKKEQAKQIKNYEKD